MTVTNPWTYRANAVGTSVGSSGAGSYAPVEGDFMVLAATNGDVLTATWSTPTGWTRVIDESVQLGAAIFYRIAEEGESTSPPVLTTSVSGHPYYRVTGFRSSTGDPANLLLSGTNAGSDTNANPTEATIDCAAAGTLTGDGFRCYVEAARRSDDGNGLGYTAGYYGPYTDGNFFSADFANSFNTVPGAGEAHRVALFGQADLNDSPFVPTLDVTFGIDGAGGGLTQYAIQALFVVDFFVPAYHAPTPAPPPNFEPASRRVHVRELPHQVSSPMFDNL